MRVEDKLADRKGRQVSGAQSAIEKGRSSSKRSKRQQRRSESMATTVQKLFRTCKEVFCDGEACVVPAPEDVDRIRSILDNLSPADVGITEKLPYFRRADNRGPSVVTYLHLYDCPKFSIGIFCLPPSACIPLHNHPEMTVFSKLLFGSMHIKSYDWVETPQSSSETIKPANFQPPGVHLAKLKADAIFTAPCDTSILYPAAGGNMHCFTARTSCAVLDVLGPPYSDAEGRHCTYYNDLPYSTFPGDAELVPREGETYAWLEERAKPDDLFMVGGQYNGPKIVDC